MSEFKNPKLLLGGAIIGGFTQEPEDHPIMGLMGVGLGAFIGSELEVVYKHSNKIKSEEIMGEAVDNADDIKVQLDGLNSNKRSAVSDEIIIDFIDSRLEESNKIKKQIRKNTGDLFSKNYQAILSDHDIVLRNDNFNAVDRAIKSGDIDDKPTKFFKHGKERELLQEGGAVDKVKEAHAKTVKETGAILDSYRDAVVKNFKTLTGTNLYDLFTPEEVDLLTKGPGSVEDPKAVIKTIRSNPKITRDTLKALSISSKRDSVQYSTDDMVYKAMLEQKEIKNPKEFIPHQRGEFVLTQSASKEERVEAIKKHLIEELKNNEGEAERIAQNIVKYSEGSKIEVSDSKIKITKPNERTAEFSLVERHMGKRVVDINGNMYVPHLSNIFGTTEGSISMPQGKNPAIWFPGIEKFAPELEDRNNPKQVNWMTRQVDFTPVESSLTESFITGKPLEDVSLEYNKHSYIGPSHLVSMHHEGIKEPPVDISRGVKTNKSSTVYRIREDIDFETMGKAVRNIELEGLAHGIQSQIPANVRSQTHSITSIEARDSVVSGISSHPERTSGVLNRGAYIEVGGGSEYNIHNAFIEATHNLAKKRMGSNLVGASLATVGTIANAGNMSAGAILYGATIGDGQTLHSMSGLKSLRPVTINLGDKPFVATNAQGEKIDLVRTAGMPTFKGGEAIMYNEDGTISVPRYIDEFQAFNLEKKGDSYKLYGRGITKVRPDSAVGFKIFGDWKSNATYAPVSELNSISLANILQQKGFLKIDQAKGNVYLSKPKRLKGENIAINAALKGIMDELKISPSDTEDPEVLRRLIDTSANYGESNGNNYSILKNLATRSNISRVNLVGRAEDMKTVSTIESIVSPYMDLGRNASDTVQRDALKSVVDSVHAVLSKSTGYDVTTGAVDSSKETNIAISELSELYDRYKTLPKSDFRTGLKDVALSASSILMAERAINDSKFSNTAAATYMYNLGELHYAALGNDEQFTLNMRTGNGAVSQVTLGKDVNLSEAMERALINISDRNKAYASSAISSSEMYSSIRDDFRELFFAVDDKIGNGFRIATTIAPQEGNDFLTGANHNKTTVSWMAQDAMRMNGITTEEIHRFTDGNEDAVYELKNRLAQRKAHGQTVQSAFGDNPDVARAKIHQIFSSETSDRLDTVDKYMKNIKHTEGRISIDLQIPEGESAKRFGKFKSVSIPLINTDYTGVTELEDGTNVSRHIDKLKRNILIRQVEYNEAQQNGSSKGYVEMSKRAYLNAVDEWIKYEKLTDKNVAKSAIKRSLKEGVSVSAIATTSNQEMLRVSRFDKGINAMFINQETFNALGLKDGKFSLLDTGINGIKKIVMSNNGDTALMGMSIREPASGPLSAMVTELYFDENLKNKGLVLAMGAPMLASQSGDLDGDKLTLGILKKSFKGFNDLYNTFKSVMVNQTDMFKGIQGEYIHGINMKMKSMLKYTDETKPISGMDSLPEDQNKKLLDSLMKGSQRDFEAPEITAIQQLVAKSLDLEYRKRVEAVNNMSIPTSEKIPMLKDLNMKFGLAFEAARSLQENILKSVRRAGGKGQNESVDNLLGSVNKIRSRIGKNPDAPMDEIGEAIYGFTKALYDDSFTTPELKALHDDVGTVMKESIINHGAAVNNSPTNLVGDKFMSSDKLTASYHYLSGPENNPYLNTEVTDLIDEKTGRRIKTVEDAYLSTMATISKNKKKLAFGGIGLAAMAFIGGAEAPNTSSPMYNAPVARTNPTLPPLEDNKSYIRQWDNSPESITVSGRRIDNQTDALFKQNLRSMFEGDRNARSTVRFEHQGY